MKHPVTTFAGDGIDLVMGLTGGEVLRSPNGNRHGEYDAYRSRRAEVRSLAAGGYISRRGVGADVLAGMVERNGGPSMTGDECCAWYIDTCIVGFEQREDAKAGSQRDHEAAEIAALEDAARCQTCDEVARCRCTRKPLPVANAVHMRADQLRILGLLAIAGPDGLSDFDYPRGRREQTSSGVRRAELVRAELAEWTGTRRPNDLGKKVRVWRITNEGLAAWAFAQQQRKKAA